MIDWSYYYKNVPWARREQVKAMQERLLVEKRFHEEQLANINAQLKELERETQTEP
jgi:hypothetical protein